MVTSRVLRVTGQQLELFFNQNMETMKLRALIGEHILSQFRSRYHDLHYATPRERYEMLLQRSPGIVEFLDLQDIASFLNVHPNTVCKIRRDKWDNLSRYFQYTEPIRRIIYTTNTVEGYHRQIRKVTKNKGVFPSDTTLEKFVYLAYRNISEKWTMPLANWALISQQLAIKFGDRYEIM